VDIRFHLRNCNHLFGHVDLWEIQDLRQSQLLVRVLLQDLVGSGGDENSCQFLVVGSRGIFQQLTTDNQ